MKLGQIADKIIPSAFKNVSEGVAKLSKGVLIHVSVATAVEILIDVIQIIKNSVDLHKNKKGKGNFGTKAEKLEKVY